MPDLAMPVQAVGTAVQNLVKVGILNCVHLPLTARCHDMQQHKTKVCTYHESESALVGEKGRLSSCTTYWLYILTNFTSAC